MTPRPTAPIPKNSRRRGDCLFCLKPPGRRVQITKFSIFSRSPPHCSKLVFTTSIYAACTYDGYYDIVDASISVWRGNQFQVVFFFFDFLVADTQLYKRLCPSVHWSVPCSVHPSVRQHELKSGKTHISAPAHLYATGGRVSGLVKKYTN